MALWTISGVVLCVEFVSLFVLAIALAPPRLITRGISFVCEK